MSFLEQLEQQARQQREQEDRKAMARAEQEIFFREVAEPTIRQLFEYLKKLIDHLNYLGTERHVSYQAPGYGQIKANLQPDLRVRFSADDEHRQIDIIGSATLPPQRQIQVSGDAEIKRLQAFLRDRGLSGGERLQRNSRGAAVAGTFRISGKISLRVVIEASIEQPDIRIHFTNFRDFGQMVKMVPPEHMDEQLMDKLGRFIGRVDDDFLKEDLDEDIRENLRRQLAAERMKKVQDLSASEQEMEKLAREENQKVEQAQNLSGRFRDRLEKAKKKLSDI